MILIFYAFSVDAYNAYNDNLTEPPENCSGFKAASACHNAEYHNVTGLAQEEPT